MEGAKGPMWDPFRGQDRVLHAAGEELQSYMDALLREMLRPEVLQSLLSGMAGAHAPPNAAGSAVAPDPYKVLGLEKAAADGEIKKRFRDLLRQLHPDTAGIDGTGFLLQLVLAAYQRIGKERGWR